MKENETATYVSPFTGVEYLIHATPQWRMAGGITEGCELYRVDYIQYDIILNGKKVQFAFTEADIENAVRHYEFPGWDRVWSSRFD